MNKDKLIKSIAATLSATFILAIAAFSVSADETQNPEQQMRGPRFSQEEMEARHAEMEAHRAEMDAIMDAGDYDAWVSAVTERHPDAEILDVINADNFDEFVAIHNIREQARELMQEADEKAEALGLKDLHPGKGKGMHKGMKRGMPFQQ